MKPRIQKRKSKKITHPTYPRNEKMNKVQKREKTYFFVSCRITLEVNEVKD